MCNQDIQCKHIRQQPKVRGESVNIVIKIIDGDKIIDYDSLSDKEKKEYGQRLNEQALTSLGYVRKE